MHLLVIRFATSESSSISCNSSSKPKWKKKKKKNNITFLFFSNKYMIIANYKSIVDMNRPILKNFVMENIKTELQNNVHQTAKYS